MSQRRTFLVHVLEDGAVVQDVSTRQRARVADLSALAAQLGQWLDGAEQAVRDGHETGEGDDEGCRRGE